MKNYRTNKEKNKSYFRRIFRIIGFIVVLFLLYSIIGIAVIDDNASTRLTFHDFYNQDNIDIAFVGASHVLRGIDPRVIEDEFDCCCFNLGSASQTYADSYYVLKELIQKNDIKTVFFNVEFCGFPREVDNKKASWIITDYLLGVNKYELIFNVFDSKDWVSMLFRLCRYKDDITLEWCKNNIAAKTCPDYWNFATTNPVYDNYSMYCYKGFCAQYEEKNSSLFIFADNYQEFDTVDLDSFNPLAIEYISKSIELCKENEVEIILFSAPVSRFYIEQSGDYSGFIDYMNSYAEEMHVEYIDFNLLLGADFSDEYFFDLDHLNYDGAQYFSHIIVGFLRDPSSCNFATTIDEIEHPSIVGVTYETSKGGSVYKWEICTKEHLDNFLYRILLKDENDVNIFESELLSEPVYEFEENPEYYVYLEIYDKNGSCLGCGRFE